MPDKFIVPERVTREAYIDLLEQLEAEKKWGRNQADLLTDCATENERLKEQYEVLKQAAQEVEGIAFRQYLDWMHFHEVAMAKPFEAETEAQDFARRVSSLLTIALGADTTLKVIDGSNPAKRPKIVSYEADGDGRMYARYDNGDVLPTGKILAPFAGESDISPERYAAFIPAKEPKA